MTHHIIPIERIEQEAKAAALKFATPDEACPYPFDSEAGKLFKAAFLKARGAMSVQDQPKPRPATDWSAA